MWRRTTRRRRGSPLAGRSRGVPRSRGGGERACSSLAARAGRRPGGARTRGRAFRRVQPRREASGSVRGTLVRDRLEPVERGRPHPAPGRGGAPRVACPLTPPPLGRDVPVPHHALDEPRPVRRPRLPGHPPAEHVVGVRPDSDRPAPVVAERLDHLADRVVGEPDRGGPVRRLDHPSRPVVGERLDGLGVGPGREHPLDQPSRPVGQRVMCQRERGYGEQPKEKQRHSYGDAATPKLDPT